MLLAERNLFTKNVETNCASNLQIFVKNREHCIVDFLMKKKDNL